MTTSAPYKVGDPITVMHSCVDHFALTAFPVQKVTPMDADERGPRWRIHVTRCDGSPMEMTVRRNGIDIHGYSRPGTVR